VSSVNVTSRATIIRAAVHGQAARMLNEAAQELVETSIAVAPEDTGFLKSKIEQTEIATAEGLTARAESGAEYSYPVNNGHHTASGSYVPPNPFFDAGIEAAKAKMRDVKVDLR
jgi:hypothetical protein